MKLHDLEPSGNCYKVRLFCALIGQPLELISVNFMAGEHKSAPYLAMNSFGEIPILDDDGIILRDSMAILVYLATKHNLDAWYPSNAKDRALVTQWLSSSVNNVMHGPGDARLIDKFGYTLNREIAHEISARILGIMNTHLANREWLELGRCTIADIACMPYIGVSYEGGVSLDSYPNIRAWIARIKALPNFIPMSGI